MQLVCRVRSAEAMKKPEDFTAAAKLTALACISSELDAESVNNIF